MKAEYIGNSMCPDPAGAGSRDLCGHCMKTMRIQLKKDVRRAGGGSYTIHWINQRGEQLVEKGLYTYGFWET